MLQKALTSPYSLLKEPQAFSHLRIYYDINIKDTMQSIVCEASCHQSFIFNVAMDKQTDKQHQDLPVCFDRQLAFEYRNFVYNIVLVDS